MSDTERWLAASAAARKSQHHFPADCLAEAALTVEILRGELDRHRAVIDAARAWARHVDDLDALAWSDSALDDLRDAVRALDACGRNPIHCPSCHTGTVCTRVRALDGE